MRPTLARVNTDAITANAERLARLAPEAAFCAVVKADGYGHGAVAAAQAALAGGASWLAVATLEEALEAAVAAEAVGRDTPVLILSELTPSEAAEAARTAPAGIRFTVASPTGIEALASGGATRRVHLKVDTGMHRMGATASELDAVAAALCRHSGRLRLEAVWTHLADADTDAGAGIRAESDATSHSDEAASFTEEQLRRFDEASGDQPANTSAASGFTGEQLRRFDEALATLRGRGLNAAMTHAANSAGLLAHPQSHHNMVRVGIALYGVPPAPALSGAAELEPALSLVSRVTAVRTVERGESVSYGRLWHADEPTRVATVPIGYADGVRRDSGAAGVEVLLRGRRCPIVGAVTMDQLMAAAPGDIADETAVGDEVVLIGRQGSDEITATEIAERLGTIAYEVVTGISARVPRQVL